MYLKVHKEGGQPKEATVIRVTETEYTIIEILGDESICGYQLFKKSNGKLKLNALYVQLARMKSKGFIDSRVEENVGKRLPKVFYSNVFSILGRCSASGNPIEE